MKGFPVQKFGLLVMIVCMAVAWFAASVSMSMRMQKAEDPQVRNVDNVLYIRMIDHETVSLTDEQVRSARRVVVSHAKQRNRVVIRTESTESVHLLASKVELVSKYGMVFMLSPDGILLAVGERTDTAGFVAAAGRVSDEDFLNGVNKFTDVIDEGMNYRMEDGCIILVGMPSDSVNAKVLERFKESADQPLDPSP